MDLIETIEITIIFLVFIISLFTKKEKSKKIVMVKKKPEGPYQRLIKILNYDIKLKEIYIKKR